MHHIPLNSATEVTSDCYQLSFDGWQPSISMLEPRWNPASSSLGTEWYISGGQGVDNEYLDTSEFL